LLPPATLYDVYIGWGTYFVHIEIKETFSLGVISNKGEKIPVFAI
jgi:hypothetical protein